MFSPSELTLAPFDPTQWTDNDLIFDFFKMIGLIEAIQLQRQFNNADKNIGLPMSLIEVIRLSNAIVPMGSETHAAFVHGLYELCKQFPEFYPKDTSIMKDAQRRDCFRKLEKIFRSIVPTSERVSGKHSCIGNVRISRRGSARHCWATGERAAALPRNEPDPRLHLSKKYRSAPNGRRATASRVRNKN